MRGVLLSGNRLCLLGTEVMGVKGAQRALGTFGGAVVGCRCRLCPEGSFTALRTGIRQQSLRD